MCAGHPHRASPCRPASTTASRAASTPTRAPLLCAAHPAARAAEWLTRGEVQKLVVVFTGVESRLVLERWMFVVEMDRAALAPGCVPRRCCCRRRAGGRGGAARGADADAPAPAPRARPVQRRPNPTPSLARSCRATRHKGHKEIAAEIAAVIRQITASVTFLPLLDEPCTFDVLAHTDAAVAVPGAWEESDPRHIAGAASEVQLRSVSTSIHSVAPVVSYRAAAPGDA